MMRIVERAGSALYVVIFGIFATALGVAPLTQSNLWAIDVEGTYTGTAKCTRYNADGTMMKTDRAMTVDITQGDEVEGVSDLNIRIQLDTEFWFLDGVSRDDAKKPGKKGTVTGVLCENSPDSSAANAVINGLVRRAHKPLKTKIKKGFANITGEGFNETCKWKVKRFEVDDPEIPDCADAPDTSDTGDGTTDTGDGTTGTGDGTTGTGDGTTGTGDGTGTDGTGTGGLNPVMGPCEGQEDICTLFPDTTPDPWCVTVNSVEVTVCCQQGFVPESASNDPIEAACCDPDNDPFCPGIL